MGRRKPLAHQTLGRQFMNPLELRWSLRNRLSPRGAHNFDRLLAVDSGSHQYPSRNQPRTSKALTAMNCNALACFKRFGKIPSYFSETCYTSGRWINEAARVVGGNVEDREKFMAAFRKVEIPDAPRGPVKLDAWGNPIQNIYVRKVERKGGELQNTVIHTFPAVSQFWTYKPDEFLKQPLYNRDQPPCRFC